MDDEEEGERRKKKAPRSLLERKGPVLTLEEKGRQRGARVGHQSAGDGGRPAVPHAVI